VDFRKDSTDDEFRLSVRHGLREQLSALFPNAGYSSSWQAHDRNLFQLWSRALDQEGWLVPTWPREWGGKNWPSHWPRILDDEYCALGCPPKDLIGIGFVGPVIYTFGSEEQKRRFLPKIRDADHIWCQGFSEPQAGSDTMSLRTVAVRHADHYVVDGQKLWTSNAHNADMMFALVRIEAKGNRRQQGLSFLLIDMHAPGVTVRPVVTIDGRHWVNEVFLENVSVPVENLVGEEGKGWVYARFLLTHERLIVAALGTIQQELNSLKEILLSLSGDDSVLQDISASRYARLEIEWLALRSLELRILEAGDQVAMVDRLTPMLKLRATELRQRISEFAMALLGDRALEVPLAAAETMSAEARPSDADPLGRERVHAATTNYLFLRASTIAGGTSEIQRNIIAATALSL
jgi:alkylation response protein AidB-like acyl-CoA dehydrogenase